MPFRPRFLSPLFLYILLSFAPAIAAAQSAPATSALLRVDGAHYPFTAAGINACIRDAQQPLASGICDARAMPAAARVEAAITDNSSPVILLLGRGLACAVTPCIRFTSSRGGAILGLDGPDLWTGASGTVLSCGGSASGPCIQLGNAAGTSEAVAIEVRNLILTLAGAGSGASTGILAFGCRYCRLENLKVLRIPAGGFGIRVTLKAPGTGAQNMILRNILDDSAGGVPLASATGLSLEGSPHRYITLPYIEKVHVNGFSFSYVSQAVLLGCTNDAAVHSPMLHVDNANDFTIIGFDMETSGDEPSALAPAPRPSPLVGLDISSAGNGVHGFHADITFAGLWSRAIKIQGAGNIHGGYISGNPNGLPPGYPAFFAPQHFTGIAAAIATRPTPYTLTPADHWVNVTGESTVTIPRAFPGHLWDVFNAGTHPVELRCDSATINAAPLIRLPPNHGLSVTSDASSCFAH